MYRENETPYAIPTLRVLLHSLILYTSIEVRLWRASLLWRSSATALWQWWLSYDASSNALSSLCAVENAEIHMSYHNTMFSVALMGYEVNPVGLCHCSSREKRVQRPNFWLNRMHTAQTYHLD